jgi:hypothetical protein
MLRTLRPHPRRPVVKAVSEPFPVIAQVMVPATTAALRTARVVGAVKVDVVKAGHAEKAVPVAKGEADGPTRRPNSGTRALSPVMRK